MKDSKSIDIDTFIEAFPLETQKQLQLIRSTIKAAAPLAIEKINYGIPTFDLNGNLVHFSGYKNHIGFYPGASGIKAFTKELSAYKSSKGSVQFPINEPLPLELITRITMMRVAENLEKSINKKPSKEKLTAGLFSDLSAPAQRALKAMGIETVEQLSKFTENDLLQLHGFGVSSLPKLRELLFKNGLHFKNDEGDYTKTN